MRLLFTAQQTRAKKRSHLPSAATLNHITSEQTDGRAPVNAFLVSVQAAERAGGILLPSVLANWTIHHALLPAPTPGAACRLHQRVHFLKGETLWEGPVLFLPRRGRSS